MSRERDLDLVVFDMAGTTVDDQGVVNLCFRDALATHGLAVEPEAVDAVMGLSKPEAIRRLVAGSSLEPLADRVDAIHAEFVRRMVRYYETHPAVRAVPGVEGLFAGLRGAGVKVALDTGFSREIADAILRRLGWAEGSVIDASVTSDEVERGRPAPDMVRHLMARLGAADPARVAKVGDAPADLEEGFAAGCRLVVGVTWGTHSRAQLAAHRSTHLVDSVDELAAILLPRTD